MWSDCINVHYGYFPWRLFLPSTLFFYPNNHSNLASGRQDPRIDLWTNQCDIWDTMLKHPFALGLVCHCAYLSIISTGFISALLNRNDEMVNILGSYCSRLHHHLKHSMGNLSLSLIHSPLQAGYKHTHSYRSCMLLERVHLSICNLYVSVSACFTCF